MNYLLHGDNAVAIRNRLTEIKEGHPGEVLTLDAKTLSPELLVQALQPESLFTTQKLIIIENPEKNKTLCDQMPAIQDGVTLVLVEEKKLTTGQIAKYQKVLPNLQPLEFKVNSVVFKFLEALKPGNQKVFLPLWQIYLATEEPEVILVMLIRQLRLLLIAAEASNVKIEDWQRLSPWQQNSFKSQTKSFPSAKLVALYQDLQTIDYQNKTGQTPLTLDKRLELFLLKL